MKRNSRFSRLESTGGLGWLRGRILRPQAGVANLWQDNYTHSGLKDSPGWRKMNPRTFHFSTGCPLNGNAAHCPGFPLPRAFILSSCGIDAYWPYTGFSIAYLGSSTLFQNKRSYRLFWGLSWDFLRRSKNALRYPRSPLPRSFKPPRHGIRLSGPFYALSMAHLGPSPPKRENRLTGRSRTSHGDTFALYLASLERSLRMQHAHQRNAKAHLGIVKDFRGGRENTFFRSGKKRKKRGSEGWRQNITPYLII